LPILTSADICAIPIHVVDGEIVCFVREGGVVSEVYYEHYCYEEEAAYEDKGAHRVAAFVGGHFNE
jgi:hypothetical protein